MASPTQGTIYTVRNAGDTADIEITGVQAASGPTSSRGEIDYTHQQSVAKQKLLGLADNGTISLNGVLIGDDVGQQELDLLFQTDPPPNRTYTITLPLEDNHTTNTVLTFSARVSGREFNSQQENIWEVSWELTVDGALGVVWGAV